MIADDFPDPGPHPPTIINDWSEAAKAESHNTWMRARRKHVAAKALDALQVVDRPLTPAEEIVVVLGLEFLDS